MLVLFFFSSRRRHTRCALVTGVQTCALPICRTRPRWIPAGLAAAARCRLGVRPHSRPHQPGEQAMIFRRSRAAFLAASILSIPVALSPVMVSPASAQWIVYDPTNYVQNVLSAARALEQINNQITSLQNEATMLIKSEERRVGKECVSTCKSRWSPYH